MILFQEATTVKRPMLEALALASIPALFMLFFLILSAPTFGIPPFLLSFMTLPFSDVPCFGKLLRSFPLSFFKRTMFSVRDAEEPELPVGGVEDMMPDRDDDSTLQKFNSPTGPPVEKTSLFASLESGGDLTVASTPGLAAFGSTLAGFMVDAAA